jgi:hypothetical protein
MGIACYPELKVLDEASYEHTIARVIKHVISPYQILHAKLQEQLQEAFLFP